MNERELHDHPEHNEFIEADLDVTEEVIRFGSSATTDESDAKLEEFVLIDEQLKNELKKIPDKMGFKIGEVADLLGIKAYVLRYWETEFEALRPKKSNQNQRMYTRKDVETALLVRKLLHRDRYSIEGARKALRGLKTQVKKDKNNDIMSESIHQISEDLAILLDSIKVIKSKLTI